LKTTPDNDEPIESPLPVEGEEPGRRPVGPGPNMPDRLPQYNLGRRTAEMRDTFFDGKGRPRIASSREVAPPSDNPFGWWQKVGEWTAWTTGRGGKFWPLNVRLNILTFYLLGKRGGNLREALLCALPWLTFAAVDAFLLAAYYLRFGVGQLILGLFITLVVAFFVAGTWAVVMSQMHFNRVRELVPFDELSLARIEPPELLYGLSIRPWASLQFFNLVHGVAMFVALAIMIPLVTGYIITRGSLPLADLLIAPILFFTVFLRWMVMTQGINHGVAYGMRARLFLRNGSQAFSQGLMHFLAQGLGFPIFAPLLFGLLIYFAETIGACLFMILAFALLWVFQIVFREIQHRTWRILKSTLKYHKQWAVYNDTAGDSIPSLAKDVY